MRKIEVRHPYFDRVEYGHCNCVVFLNRTFPIQSFRLSTVEAQSIYVEVEADVGFRHDDGLVDWVRGQGVTFEEAIVDALQYFLNLVVYPEALSESLVWRDEIE